MMETRPPIEPLKPLTASGRLLGLAFGLCGLCGLFLAVGCDPDDGAVAIRVINQPRWKSSIDQAVAAWNEAHPEQEVIVEQLVVGYPQLRGKLITAVGGGKPPDLALIDSVWLAEFARSGHLAALDEIDREWCENDYKRDFYPVFHRGEWFDGHLWGVRTQTDLAVLWYRRDWFEAEGVEPPTSWQRLVDAGRHFRDEEVRSRHALGEYPLAMPLGTKARETLVYQILPFFWANGGGILDGGDGDDSDGDDSGIRLNRPENIETLRFLRDLVREHRIVSPEAIGFEWDRAMKLFAGGRVAMAVGGTYEKKLIREASGWDEETFRQRAGHTLIPGGSTGQASTTAGGMSYVVFRDAPHRRLAFEILRLAVAPESMRRFCLETNQHPPRRSVAEGLDPAGQPFLAATAPGLENARTRPVLAKYAQVSDILQQAIEATVRGEVSAAEALRDGEKRLLELVER